jgi:hypothetical protein
MMQHATAVEIGETPDGHSCSIRPSGLWDNPKPFVTPTCKFVTLPSLRLTSIVKLGLDIYPSRTGPIFRVGGLGLFTLKRDDAKVGL